MRCSKCGAPILAGKIYCSVCGAEVRLVPDYNFLEDDMLSDIVSQGVNGTTEKKKRILAKKDAGEDKKTIVKYRILWALVGVLALASVVVLFYVSHRIVEYQKNSYDYQYDLAAECQDENQLEDALYYYGRAWELRPEDINAPYEMADIYLEMGQEDKAASVIEQVVSRNGYDKESCQKLIDIYESQEDYDKIRELSGKVEGNIELQELFESYTVKQPEFKPDSGTYASDRIEIVSSSGYDIYYTTDGSDPVVSGRLYQGEIILKKGKTLVLAVAKSPKGFYSEVAEALYTIQKNR